MAEEDPNVDPVEDPEIDPTEGDEYTPPSKEEWEKLKRTAAVRKQERDEARRAAAAAREGGTQPTDAEKAAQEARESRDKLARRSAGLAALVEAGMTRVQAKEAVGLLKLKGLEVDEDGDVDGVDDAVADLKTKFPGLFPAKQGKGRRQVTADAGSGGQSTKTPTQRTNDALMKALGIGG